MVDGTIEFDGVVMTLHRIGRAAVAAWIGAAVVILAAGPAAAICERPVQPGPLPAAQALASNPQSLLGRPQQSQNGLAMELRNLIVSDQRYIDAVPALIAAATDEQKRAIGSALGQAANLCVGKDPIFARNLQEAVVSADSPPVTLAFQALSRETATAATGSSGSAGGSSGGGAGGTGSGTFNAGAGSSRGAAGGGSVPNTSGAPFTTSGSSLSTGGTRDGFSNVLGTTTTSFITAPIPVSP